MQLTIFHLQVLIYAVLLRFRAAEARPTLFGRGPTKIVIEVAPGNQTSDVSRMMNFGPSANSFTERTHFCGQKTETNTTQNEVARKIVSHRASKLNALRLELQSKGMGAHANLILTTQMKPISVVFHVLYDEKDGSGNVTDEAIAAQIQVMNQDYGRHGFQYKLVNTTRTANSTFFNQGSPGSSSETDMKKLLYQGDASTLNVYSVSFQDNLLGYSTWPWDFESDPSNDGIVFLYSTLPGGDAQDYNQGKTLVHEAGHWNGLYHTFEGGCDGDGDEVDDTAPEGCPNNKDTCKGDSLLDPVHNFMDYSVDECLTTFTQGALTKCQSNCLDGPLRLLTSSVHLLHPRCIYLYFRQN